MFSGRWIPVKVKTTCHQWFAEEEERLFASTLTYLQICSLNCETTDGAKWFGHLNSLQTLIIFNCPALRCLPESGLPTSLSHLRINGCPLLQKRCQTETGEDWPKISHIPHLRIDEISVSTVHRICRTSYTL
ncbi:hypothetical protein ABKV19_022639 [Rosa sericea]